MEQHELSPGELKRARKQYYFLALFNVLSFQLITGNIITLFALRLGAGNSFVGLLSSFLYISFFFLIIGRFLVARFGIVRLMGVFFIVRLVLFIPMPLAAFFAGPETRGIAFALMIFSSAGFNIARGIAIVSDSPIVASLSGTKDRGVFLSKVQIISQIMAISGAILMANLLGDEAPLWRFVIIMYAGIASGFLGSIFLFKLPEPKEALKGAEEKILHSVRTAFGAANSRRFFIATFLIHASAAMFGSFLVVFLKNVYGFPDNRLVLFSALANIGALAMAVLSGLTMDRIGAKPLYFSFTFVGLVSVFVAIISPNLSGAPLLAYAGILFFLWGMGSAGMGNSGLSYFIGTTETSKRINYGIIYFFVLGLGGTFGSIAGGNFLDLLTATFGLGYAESFRIYFAFIALGITSILFVIQSLENAGAYPIRDAIMFFLSPRDMRALSLLRRLDTAETEDEESRVIRELQDVPSELAMDGVIQKIRSPSFQVRSQALEALAAAPLNGKVRRILIAEVKNNAYTTGSMAARIIGNRGIAEAVPQLRKAIRSPDTLLAGESMVALGKLRDRESLPEIEAILEETRNPRLIIHSAKALEYFYALSSFKVLLRKLESKQVPFIRDELILSLSGFFGLADWFYPRYVRFLEKSSLGISILKDDIESALKDEGDPLRQALAGLAENTAKGGWQYRAAAVELVRKSGITLNGESAVQTLEDTASGSTLAQLPRFRFFLAAILVRCFTV